MWLFPRGAQEVLNTLSQCGNKDMGDEGSLAALRHSHSNQCMGRFDSIAQLIHTFYILLTKPPQLTPSLLIISIPLLPINFFFLLSSFRP